MAIAPIPPFPALSDRANGTYNGKAFDWASHMANTFVPEANALAANLNSIAAGGAYAIPYVFDNTTNLFGTSSGGVLAVQPSLSQIYIDTKDSAGGAAAARLTSMVAGVGSAVKGQVRLVKVGDPSKWMMFNLLSYSEQPGGLHGLAQVDAFASSGISPFTPGDSVILHFQRTGDKGDTGVMGVLPRAKFREQRASGTSGGIAVNGANTRDLNTTEFNSISGASLAASSVTLPAGTYDFQGWAMRYSSGSGLGGHKAYLHNVTDNATVSFGSSGSIGTLGINDRSLVSGRFTIAAAKTFQLRHYIEATSGSGQSLGFASSSGFAEVYSEIEFLKVA